MEHSEKSRTAGKSWSRSLLVFAVFFVQGAWPAPDVNEPNYLGKADPLLEPRLGPARFLPAARPTRIGSSISPSAGCRGGCGRRPWRGWPLAHLGPAGLGVAAVEFRRGAAARGSRR